MNDAIKCIVWDLDDTLWDGVCLEGRVTVRSDVVETIQELDRRGILHSIASRGDANCAIRILKDHELDGYFLVPRINWLPKSQNIAAISRDLDISLDKIAFVDDDVFEREQIAYMLPEVRVIDAKHAGDLAKLPEFSPSVITSEARKRRLFYHAEMERKSSEQRFSTREEFLMSCGMQLRIRAMEDRDIPRVRELMTRTHQLNTTGRIFDPEEFCEAPERASGDRICVVAELYDKFGQYGIIGVAVNQTMHPVWRLQYLAISCRVMGRGIERALLASLMEAAAREELTIFEAEFCDTGRNAMMRALYQMSGFRDTGDVTDGGILVFRAADANILRIPHWVEVL